MAPCLCKKIITPMKKSHLHYTCALFYNRTGICKAFRRGQENEDEEQFWGENDAACRRARGRVLPAGGAGTGRRQPLPAALLLTYSAGEPAAYRRRRQRSRRRYSESRALAGRHAD